MKKSLSCAELGVSNCTFEVRSENTQDIKDALMFHAQKVHPEKVNNLTENQKNEMSNQMDKMMHQVAY